MVVDASVVVSHLVPRDIHHDASRRWLGRHVADGGLVISPALLLAELAGAIARRTRSARLAQRAVAAVLAVPSLRLVPVDDELGRAAARLAARLGLRGADAVYIATAAMLGVPLVTWDAEQRDRASVVIDVLVPG